GSEQAVAFDLSSMENKILKPGQCEKINTGICVMPPPGYYIQLALRSSAAITGYTLDARVIDPDYRGPIYAVLSNYTDHDLAIYQGDRLVQGVLLPHMSCQFKLVESLPSTQHQDQGFGSS
ncbi:dUTPase-like protein, partial [Dimargaris cristalligena]